MNFPFRSLMIFPLFAGLCSVVQAARVGILDFRSDAAKPTQSFLSQTLPNALAEPLTSQTGITVVERSQLSRLVEEKGLESLSEKVPDSLRTLFPADDLVMGEFAGSLDSLVLQVRVVECATGTVKGAFSRKGSLQEILSGMPGLATQIALAVRGDSSGRLSVSSRPSGANVFLDGTILGRTPLVDQRIPPGRHALSLELDHFQTWTDSVIIEPSATIGRKVELAEDDDRSGIWFGGGGQINGLTRDLGDAAGPSYSGFLSIVGRAQRFGVEISYLFPTTKTYAVTFPVPWGERSVSRDLQCDLARVLVVGDVLQAGPWSSHLGLGLGFTRVELDPQDFSSSVTQEKSLLGAAASAGLHYQFRRWMEVVTEISAFHSFEELHVVDIESRDLFSTTRKENVFPIQIWSAQIAARFRIP